MTGNGDGDGNERDGDPAESGPRFADLVPDTQRLEKGPRRADRPATRLKPGRRRTTGSGQARSSSFRWPDPVNPFCAGAEGVSDQQIAALSRGEPEPQERIDLHGARRDGAGRLLTKRLESAHTRGLSCVLVIHGRGQNSVSGEAVLREALPGWLTEGPAAHRVLAFTPAPERLGGEGATLVLLRRGERSR